MSDVYTWEFFIKKKNAFVFFARRDFFYHYNFVAAFIKFDLEVWRPRYGLTKNVVTRGWRIHIGKLGHFLIATNIGVELL